MVSALMDFRKFCACKGTRAKESRMTSRDVEVRSKSGGFRRCAMGGEAIAEF